MTKTRTFFGHPWGLLTLFSTEMWERFNYYGMRALLMLFLTASFASGGFGLEQNAAQVIYGVFTALVYVTPIIGGILADKILGQRKSIYIGALSMAIGQLLLTYSAIISADMLEFKQNIFFIGLGVLICGNGFFKPNISTMVGDLYESSDPRRDGAFTLFYMGINIGATLGPFAAGWLGEGISWEYGFLASAVAMLIGFTWFFMSHKALGATGMPPKYKKTKTRLLPKDSVDIALYIVGIIVLVSIVVIGWKVTPKIILNIIVALCAIGGVGYLGFSIFKNTSGKTEWSRVAVILVLALANIFFWSGYEQAGSTFNIFIRDQVDRTIGDFEIPAAWFQMINAIFVVLFAPLFAVLWAKLDKMKLNPNTPMKFSWSLFLLSAGFVVMALANERASNGILVSPMWLVLVFLLHVFGELFMSPIGLSMVTRLSPVKLVSTMMGVWMGSFAFGNYLAAMLKPIVEKFDLPLFWFIAIETAFVGVILAIAAPFLKRMMRGLR